MRKSDAGHRGRGASRTFQAAMKKFGPALLEFLPPHLKTIYDRVPEKRVKKDKPAPYEFDTGPLIAVATSHRLNLN